MEICRRHWKRVREALNVRNLLGLGEDGFDPPRVADWLLKGAAEKVRELEILELAEVECPVCAVVKGYESDIIDGAADEVLLQARERGLLG